MDRHCSKPGTPGPILSKTIIIGWLRTLFPDMPQSIKIEDFGDGVIYCRLLNHHYGNPPFNKVTWHPKNQYEYCNNLRQVQTALTQLSLIIPFDVNKVAKRKFLENWALINSLYKHINSDEVPNTHINQDESASSQGNQIIKQHPGKRPMPAYFAQPEIDPRVPHKLPAYNQPISTWESPLHANIGQIAKNSLNMTQYLKENINIYNNSPNKGKWSVGSQMFQNNYSAVVDRVKQILLKGSHDTQKIRQIKMLLGMPLEEQQIIKIEDDEAIGQIIFKPKQQPQEKPEIHHSQPNSAQVSQIRAKQSCSKDCKASVSKVLKKPFKI